MRVKRSKKATAWPLPRRLYVYQSGGAGRLPTYTPFPVEGVNGPRTIRRRLSELHSKKIVRDPPARLNLFVLTYHRPARECLIETAHVKEGGGGYDDIACVLDEHGQELRRLDHGYCYTQPTTVVHLHNELNLDFVRRV